MATRGFSLLSCWDIISHDAILDFFVRVPVPRIISSALLFLIPKKTNPISFADFRPISLCNFANKICSNILANRLCLTLPHLSFPEQSSFVQGRTMVDNILLLRKCYIL
ncbi:hypothetical protein ACH5RR_001131 [Cinchona calisaya]|uniref:Reverse transcriptase domain-containing protein n=1 Tax=Cinchona calisaya TaxID=153742 RepID=A0ABD3B2J6_9GENT